MTKWDKFKRKKISLNLTQHSLFVFFVIILYVNIIIIIVALQLLIPPYCCSFQHLLPLQQLNRYFVSFLTFNIVLTIIQYYWHHCPYCYIWLLLLSLLLLLPATNTIFFISLSIYILYQYRLFNQLSFLKKMICLDIYYTSNTEFDNNNKINRCQNVNLARPNTTQQKKHSE